jgi:hypothetical protein
MVTGGPFQPMLFLGSGNAATALWCRSQERPDVGTFQRASQPSRLKRAGVEFIDGMEEAQGPACESEGKPRNRCVATEKS